MQTQLRELNKGAYQEGFDFLQLSSQKKIIKILTAGECIVISCVVTKFNRKEKQQQRTLMLTTHAVYNLKKYDLKRRIPIEKVAGITISQPGAEFVLHVPTEYDYRYSSLEYRELIIEQLTKKLRVGIRVFYRDVIQLKEFVTTRIDKKKNLSRMPQHLFEQLDPFIQESKKMNNRIGVDDFVLKKVLGRGTFGKKDDQKFYAMKSIRKENILDPAALAHTKLERDILEKNKSLFLVKLEMAFMTPEKLFFLMDFKQGGELFQHLRREGKFTEDRTRFYAAELTLALHDLHTENVVYRDLKPENVLLDSEGHVCLTDFGVSKILPSKEAKTNSFVGTAEYVSPEIINTAGHSFSTDIWSLGAMIYEMLYGVPPFYSKQQQIMFELIKKKEVKFPEQPIISPQSKDLIQRMLEKDPEKRIVHEEILKHDWFQSVDWQLLAKKQVPAPFIPENDWLKNFDETFTKEEPVNTFQPFNPLLAQHDKEFQGIYYDRTRDDK